jgi:soluble lytic murein transglycosylase-like protein
MTNLFHLSPALLAGVLLLALSCEASRPVLAQEQNVCEREMMAAAEAENIPLGVLYAVGLTETGRRGSLHPYALNIEGKSVFAKSERDALAEFAAARRKGKKLIDLGCMQINHHYHGSEFDSPADMLHPHKNVRYAARFLKQLRQREGNWTMAVARYHAGPNNNPAQKRYICAVIRNLTATGFGGWTPEARKFCGERPQKTRFSPASGLRKPGTP